LTAKAYYAHALADDGVAYLHGLMRMRACWINLKLPRIDAASFFLAPAADPSLVLHPPFMETYASQYTFKEVQWAAFAFTSFLSPSFVPFYIFAGLRDEIHSLHNCILCRYEVVADVVQLTSAIWMKGFDQQLGVASDIAWRVSIWRSLLERTEGSVLQLFTNIQECLAKNHSALASLFANSGAVQQALVQAEALTWLTPSSRAVKIRANRETLPRLVTWLSQIPPPLFNSLRSSAYLLLRDYASVDTLTERQWVTVIYGILRTFPSLVNVDFVMARLLSDINTGEPRMRLQLAFLVLILLQRDATLEKHLLLPKDQMSDDQKRLWTQLLPQLFIVCPKIKLPFLSILLQANPVTFLLQFRDIECRGIITDHEYLTVVKEAFTQKPNDRPHRDILNFYSFLEQCKDDIDRLDRSVEALDILLRYLALNRSDGLLERNHFSSPEDVLSFCEANPPVFRASKPLPDFFSLFTMKVPLFGHPTARITLEADGHHEALMRLIPLSGESHLVALLSPRLYRFSQAEYLFLTALARMFHNHASCVTRAHFVSYPDSHMIHPKLLAVDTRTVVSFRGIVQPYNLLRLLFEAASGRSHRASLPDDLLLNWAIRGADGNRANFLFCRQGIAAHYAAISCLQLIIRPGAALAPPILFGVDRQRVIYPGMLQGRSTATFPPLTDQVRRYLPDFVLRGAFTATWHAVAAAMAKNIAKVQMLVQALLPAERTHLAIPQRIEKTAVAVSKDTDKSDAVWAFDIVDHLIECSTNVMRADLTRIAWV
jgi:hypothetical protein